MDPISGNNPINNPRLDLLHNTGDNQQLDGLNGVAGSYTAAAGPQAQAPRPAPMPSSRLTATPGGAPNSAASYVAAAQANRQAATPMSVPMPEPRPAPSVPMYAAASSGEEGGIGIAALVIGIIVLLLATGGMYLVFSSQLSSQNKKLQSAVDQLKNDGGGVNGDIKTNTIDNSDKITTKTLEVTENEDGIDGLTVDGASNLQGPVKVGQDLSVGGNLDVTGSVTAASFKGDGSQLTGLAAGVQGTPGARGATGPAGAPNPNAINAKHADRASAADNATHASDSDTVGGLGAGAFVQLQGENSTDTFQTGNIQVSGNFRSMANLDPVTLTATAGTVTPNTGENVLDSNSNHFFKLVTFSGTDVIATSPTTECSTGPTENSCTLSWPAQLGATSYTIYRADPNTTNFTAYRSNVGTKSGSTYTYVYRNTDGESTANPVPGVQVPLSTARLGGITGDNFVLGSLGVNTAQPGTGYMLDVNGDANVSGSLRVGTLTIASNLTVGGVIFSNGDLKVGCDGNGANCSATMTASNGNIDSNGAITGASLSAGSGSISGGSLDVGTGSISGGAISGSSLAISGASATVNGANVCTDASVCTGYQPAGSYINNQNTLQSGAELYVGTARAQTLLGDNDSFIGTIAGGPTAKLGINTGVAGAAYALHVVGDIHNQSGNISSGGSMFAVGDIRAGSEVGGGNGNNGANIRAYCTPGLGGTDCAGGGVITADDHFSIGRNGGHVGFDHGVNCQTVTVWGGIVTGCDASGDNSDYAEKYPSLQVLSAGEVVAVDSTNPENVVRTTYANQASAIGIVSTAPGQTIGSGNTVVAEAGRVPVKVTSEGGAIAAGDYLTSSSTPGYAMKAAAGMKTIGIAMNGFSGSTGTVTAFVNISNGGAASAPAPADANTSQTTQQPAQSTNQFADLNVSGSSTFDNLKVTGLAELASLKVTGTATVATLVVNGHIIGNADTRGTVVVPAGATSARHAFTSAYTAVPVVVVSPVTASASYHVTPDANGFTVTVDTAPTADLKFNYLVQQ